MQVIHSSSLASVKLPGLVHRTLASAQAGIGSFEVWQQSMASGAATPLHRHNCDEVIIITAGTGVMRQGGVEHAFATGDVLLCQPNELHEIVNTGTTQLDLYGVLGLSPVPVLDADGNVIARPW